ncbi:MAG TPA: thiazole synthase, partial [Candidatus Binatia bacterium]|nr:thiazole synthase [Candidatus Binatia bacterium]
MHDPFVLAGREYRSRLITGSGKYASFAQTRAAAEAAGAEIVTVAVRRVNVTDPGKENLLDHLTPDRFTILPNTAGCYTAEEAIRTCRLAREAGIGTLVKLEV